MLSANDTGETGGHQAGILVPKDPRVLNFFPWLDPSQKNPRLFLTFEDEHKLQWNFAFIYYNNRLFGGTRNEYRLTRMTGFLMLNKLQQGDTIIMRKPGNGLFDISCVRKRVPDIDENGVLKLRGGWKVINF